jgi:pimeloyl-ACP methyl ester carboxylesterase
VAPAPAATPPARPRFVLIHGSWHGAWCWYRVAALLEHAGYQVTAVDLPSHGIDRTPPERVTLQDYTDRVVESLDTSDQPVILVGHSMGGIAISEAAEARPGKVQALVYLAAYLLPDGASAAQFSTLDTDSLLNRHLRFVDHDGDGTVDVLDVDPAAVRDAFYARSPAADVALSRLLLVVDPLRPVITPLHLGASYDRVRRFYIRTTQDQAVSPALQARMYTQTPVERVFTVRSDHSPFFSQPVKLAKILRTIAAR